MVIRLRPTIDLIFPIAPFRFGKELLAIPAPTTVVIVGDEVRHAQPRQHQEGIVAGAGWSAERFSMNWDLHKRASAPAPSPQASKPRAAANPPPPLLAPLPA